MSFVILFYNALCKRQTKSPTTFFSSETRSKNIGNICLANALSCVRHIYYNTMFHVHHLNCDGSFTANCIDSVLTKVLYHPLNQQHIDACHSGFGTQLRFYCNATRCSFTYISCHFQHNIIHIAWLKSRLRAYFREPIGNKLKAFHIFAHICYKWIVRILLLKYLVPSHQTRYRCTQLVCCFFRQTNPQAVLFCLFAP